MNPLQAALAGITHDDPRHRDLAVESLADLLYGYRPSLHKAEAELAVRHLVELLTTEADTTVQESALHAICQALDHYQFSLELFQPLRTLLGALPPV